MSWFIIALIAPFFWTITSYIDKYLISKYFKGGGIGALMILSAMIGFILLPIIYIIEPGAINLKMSFAIVLTLNGVLYVMGILPYLYAMKEGEASVVVPLFQLTPLFSYFLALIILKETLTVSQIIASLFIVFGAIIISINPGHGQKKFKAKVFWLMVLSSFIIALNSLIFKFVAIRTTFWTTSFWEYVGFSIFAVILFVFARSYRRQFLLVFKHNRLTVLTINGINEILNILAKIILNFATILAPLALAWVATGFQPFFVLLFGVLLAFFFPKITDESLNKKYLLQKAIAIIIMFIGTYLLNI